MSPRSIASVRDSSQSQPANNAPQIMAEGQTSTEQAQISTRAMEEAAEESRPAQSRSHSRSSAQQSQLSAGMGSQFAPSSILGQHPRTNNGNSAAGATQNWRTRSHATSEYSEHREIAPESGQICCCTMCFDLDLEQSRGGRE